MEASLAFASGWDLVAWIVAAIALHRLWNAETVMAKPRQWANKIPGVRSIAACGSCNAMYIGASAWALWHPSLPWASVPALEAVRDVLAAYIAAVTYVAWLWSIQAKQTTNVSPNVVRVTTAGGNNNESRATHPPGTGGSDPRT